MTAEKLPGTIELPAPSAELVLIRVMVCAYLATAHERPKRRGRAFVREAARLLNSEDSVTLLLPGRSVGHHAGVTEAGRRAIAHFKQLLPTMLAALPPE